MALALQSSGVASLASASCAAAVASAWPAVGRPAPGGRLVTSFAGQRVQARRHWRQVPASCREGVKGSVICAVANIGQDDFETEVLNSSLPVLVDFWAHWCGPCKLVAPLMDWAAKEYDGKLKVVKIETDPNPKLVEKYKVYGLPTIIIFDKGAAVSQVEGAINKTKLQRLIREKIPALS